MASQLVRQNIDVVSDLLGLDDGRWRWRLRASDLCSERLFPIDCVALNRDLRDNPKLLVANVGLLQTV